MVEEPKEEEQEEQEQERTHKGDTEEHNGATRLHQTGIEDFSFGDSWRGWTWISLKLKYDSINVVQ